LALIECGGFCTIAALCHAAPSPPMIFGCVVEVQNAIGAFTFSQVRWIAIGDQIGG